MRKQTIILLIAILLTFCTSPKNNLITEKIINIPVNIEDIKHEKISEYCKDYKIITLETSSKCLIKNITRLVPYNNRLYIFDKDLNTVFIFSDTGKYITKIHKIGKGPQEYLQLTDFTIDKENSELILSADRPYKFLYYNLDGEYIDEKRQKTFFMNISNTKDKLVFYNKFIKKGTQNFKIWMQNKNKKKVDKYIPFDDPRNLGVGTGYSSLIKSMDIYLTEPFNDTVYKITNEGAFPAYYIDFGKNKIPGNYFKKNKGKSKEEIINEFIDQNNGFFLSNFRQTKKYIFFRASNTFFIYDKLTKETKTFYGIMDDITGLNVSYFAHDGNDNKFLTILPADYFIDFVHKTNPEYRSHYKDFNKIYEIAKKLDFMDNPVLVFYTLKD